MPRERIDVDEAERLKVEFGSWREVAGVMQRQDGSRFQAVAIQNAVLRRRREARLSAEAWPEPFPCP